MNQASWSLYELIQDEHFSLREKLNYRRVVTMDTGEQVLGGEVS